MPKYRVISETSNSQKPLTGYTNKFFAVVSVHSGISNPTYSSFYLERGIIEKQILLLLEVPSIQLAIFVVFSSFVVLHIRVP